MAAAPAGAATLRARNGATVRHGVQHFRSRTDLRAPQIVIDKRRSRPLGGLVVTDVHGGPSQQGPLLLDQTGRLIWFLPLSPKPTASRRAFNVRVQSYQGRPVLSFWQGTVIGDHGRGSYAIYDSTYRRLYTVKAAHGQQADLHEFLLTDRGTALFSCYGRAQGRVRVAGGWRRVPYTYGIVQEVDVASGRLLFEWRSDRHIPLSDSYKPLPRKSGQDWDYFHVNSIAIDPSDQNLIISGRNTWACYKVDRRSGRVIWKLGGRRSDFRMGRGTRFIYQHDAELHPGGLLSVFDNRGGPPRHGFSRAVLLSVDERRRRVTLRHSCSHHPQVYSDALGSVQLLAGGDIFVGWGRSTNFSEYSARGALLFDGHLAAGASSYRAFLSSWQGAPGSAPAAVAVRSGSTGTVHVSWNGATEVRRWGVIDAASGASLGAALANWFETAITVPNAPPSLKVAAYDAGGRQLATSPAFH
jgi:hypothetical protein